MVRTKQTARESSAPRPGGMATARFAGRGRGRGDPEAQFADDPLDIADEDLPDVLKMLTSRREVNQAQVSQ